MRNEIIISRDRKGECSITCASERECVFRVVPASLFLPALFSPKYLPGTARCREENSIYRVKERIQRRIGFQPATHFIRAVCSLALSPVVPATWTKLDTALPGTRASATLSEEIRVSERAGTRWMTKERGENENEEREEETRVQGENLSGDVGTGVGQFILLY